MNAIATLPAFLTAVVLISVSPGPAMALIFRRAALRGLRPVIATVLGLEVGIYLWALAAGAGLAALVAASQTAYLVLRITGAVFLFALGLRAWLRVWRSRGDDTKSPDDCRPDAGRAHLAFVEGLVVQLANPKAAIFMFAFYPQFVHAGQPLLATTAVLAVLQVAVESSLYLALAAVVSQAGTWFSRPKVRRRLEAVTGTVLIGLGLRVAVSHR